MDTHQEFMFDRLRSDYASKTGNLERLHDVVHALGALEWPNQLSAVQLATRKVRPMFIATNDLHGSL
jgi:hypothetical protein